MVSGIFYVPWNVSSFWSCSSHKYESWCDTKEPNFPECKVPHHSNSIYEEEHLNFTTLTCTLLKIWTCACFKSSIKNLITSFYKRNNNTC